jgi:protein-disulfide isomerase
MMKQNITQYLMIALLVVGAYMVGVYKTKVEYLENGAPGTVAQVAGEQAAVPEEKVELTEEEWKQATEGEFAYGYGDPEAPVTLVEYTDYQCPFCARFFEQTYEQLKTTYVDTGKVRYIMRDLPLPFHANAKDAAIAARCAGKQGKYLEMHDKLFGSQTDWSEVADAIEKFSAYAGELGMNTSQFSSCMTDQAVATQVDNDTNLASQLGATGTPTFIINGKLLVGAQPYTAFEAMIDGEL